MSPRSVRLAAARARLAQWYGSFAKFLKATLGDVAWTPPPWVAALRAREAALVARATADPRLFRRNAIATAAALVALWGALLLWRHRPQAIRTDFTINPPAATDLTAEHPRPRPLRVVFESSVAPLQTVGKVLKSGVDLSPNIAGIWRWRGDRELEFEPTEDWPVGQTFSVSLQRKGFVAPTVTLERYGFEFASGPFNVSVSAAEFYQDPIDPNLKRVVLKLTFSHPVDSASLMKHVSLRMEGESGGLLSGLQSLPFTVAVDKKSLAASVLSGALAIPAKTGLMRMTVDAGVRSSRGGPATAQALEQRVQIPGLFSLAVQGAELTLVRNERYEPEQVLVLALSADVGEKDFQQSVAAWVLPIYNPSTPPDQRVRPWVWNQPNIIGPEILQASTPLALSPVPAEREYTTRQAFHYSADPGRFIYVRVTKGLRSFGGYVLGETWDGTSVIPPFPKEIKILGSGSLLSLSGDRKVSIYSRDVPALLVEVGRVVPNQLQHLVTQTSRHDCRPAARARQAALPAVRPGPLPLGWRAAEGPVPPLRPGVRPDCQACQRPARSPPDPPHRPRSAREAERRRRPGRVRAVLADGRTARGRYGGRRRQERPHGAVRRVRRGGPRAVPEPQVLRAGAHARPLLRPPRRGSLVPAARSQRSRPRPLALRCWRGVE